MLDQQNTVQSSTKQQDEKNQNNSEYGRTITTDERSEVTTRVRQVEGTPFQMRWVKEKGWAFGIGTKRVSNWFKTEKEATREINKINWRMLTAVVEIIVEAKLELIEIEKRSRTKGENA